jgi:uncharacterized protein
MRLFGGGVDSIQGWSSAETIDLEQKGPKPMLSAVRVVIVCSGLVSLCSPPKLAAQAVEMKIHKTGSRTGLENVSGDKSGAGVVTTGEELEAASGSDTVVVSSGTIRSVEPAKLEMAFKSGRSRVFPLDKTVRTCGEAGEAAAMTDLKFGAVVSVRWSPRRDSPPSGPVPGRVLSIRKGGLRYVILGPAGEKSFDAKLGDNGCQAR